jgi:hypothetical protein
MSATKVLKFVVSPHACVSAKSLGHSNFSAAAFRWLIAKALPGRACDATSRRNCGVRPVTATKNLDPQALSYLL